MVGRELDLKWTTEKTDPEVRAIERCVTALARLDDETRARVLRYLLNRFTPAAPQAPEARKNDVALALTAALDRARDERLITDAVRVGIYLDAQRRLDGRCAKCGDRQRY